MLGKVCFNQPQVLSPARKVALGHTALQTPLQGTINSNMEGEQGN